VIDADWGLLSDQAVAAAGVVYFLALLIHLAEWASLRTSAAPESRATARDGGSVIVAPGGRAERDPVRRVAFLGRLGLILTLAAAGIHVVALVGRGMAAEPNRVPWGNMYEFTLSGTFVVTLMYLVLYRRYQLEWISPLVVGFVVTVLMVAVLWLHDEVAPLPEALDSYWLVIHVVSAIIATGAFTLGGLLSAMYLLKLRKGDSTTGPLGRVPSLEVLDRMSYRIHAFAFPVWTFAVLITGPIWAKEAWSSYWNWDPKEVWAFITWVVYAAYLHARATAGWKGRNAALLALVGVATLWFNFIGINYFSSTSQHSYASAPALERTSQVEQLSLVE
jgi:cytochrome c-type biogenesis protein CcsB